jgi:hypothetical protein
MRDYRETPSCGWRLTEGKMAGLYEVLEEVAFKRTPDGYVFQTNNRWFFGPKRRFLVNEVQKGAIAGRIRETLKSIKPFVLIAAVLIPLALVGGTIWLALRGGTLTVTETHVGGAATTYSQSIGSEGSTGTLASGNSRVVFRVSGLPGDGATVTATGFDRHGNPGKPAVVAFGAGGTNVNLADDAGHVIATAHLSGRIGAPANIVGLKAGLLCLALFLPYLVAIHIYSMRRLEPLLVGLPRSSMRITMRDATERFASKMSVKLMVVMVGSTALALGLNLFNLAGAIMRHGANIEISIFGTAAAGFGAIYFAYLVMLRLRTQRNAPAMP